jgi:multimeric flavodoxin WrbA
MRPLVIVGSSRKESDTRKFIDKIFDGSDFTLIDLLDLHIQPYDYSHAYPANDQYDLLVEAFLSHHRIVFASPVYWYSMSSQMKTVFDRFSDLVTYKKMVGRQLKGKDTFLVAVGADQIMPEGYEIPFRETSDYLDMQYLGSIYHCTKNIFPENKLIEEFRNKIFRSQ